MKIIIPLAATAFAAALLLTGCSAGSLPGSSSSGAAGSGSGSSGSGSGGSSSGSGSSSSNNGPTHSYSADDLVTILKKTEAARNLSGTIKDDAEIKADDKTNPGESLTQTFASEGGSITPTACGTLLDSLITAGDAATGTLGNFTSASLQASSDIIDIATSTSSQTAEIATKVKGIMSQVTSQCSSMSLNIGGSSEKFTVASVPVTTKANQSVGYEEDISIGGQTDKTLTIEATYGNLYIGDVAVTNPSLSSMEANVNAVIAAANG